MRTTVILNLKGGVAKTATAVNVAAILANDYKQRVLLIDADSQCNSTEFYGGNPAKGNLAELLRSGSQEDAAWGIQSTRFTGVGQFWPGTRASWIWAAHQGGAAGCEGHGTQGHGAVAGCNAPV